MDSSSGDAKKADRDIEMGHVTKLTAMKANKGDIQMSRAASQLIRQITLSRNRTINRSISMRDINRSISMDLESNKEKDAKNDSSNSNGIVGGIMDLLSNLPNWLKIVLATIAFMAYPVYQRLRKAEDDIEESVTSILQVVERVAEVTNKLANDLAEVLPNDGRLKDAVKTVGDIARQVDKDAETAQAFIKMVDELGDDLDEYIDPLIKVGDLFYKDKIEEKKEKKHSPDQSLLAMDAKL